MLRTEIKELVSKTSDYQDKQVTVCGWVKTIRTSKSIGFIEINDGSTFNNLQIVFLKKQNHFLDNFSKNSQNNLLVLELPFL